VTDSRQATTSCWAECVQVVFAVGSKAEAGSDVLGLQLRKSSMISLGVFLRHHFQHVIHCNAQTTYAWFAAALAWLDGDSVR